MSDNDPQTIQLILDESLVAIKSGRETVDSILERYPHLAQELRPDLEAALWLNAHRAVLEPRPGFIAASRARLVSEIKENYAAAGTSRRTSILDTLTQVFQRKYALQFALALILFIGFVSTGIVFVEAANQSIPGDSLYTTKLVIEDAQLALPLTPVRHIRLQVRYTERRSQELEQLIQLGRFEDLSVAVARFDALTLNLVDDLDQLADARPQEALDLTASLQEIVDDQIVMLTVLTETVPEEGRVDVQNAILVTQARSLSINELLQEIFENPFELTPTLVLQPSNTSVPTSTPTLLLAATATVTPTPTASSTTTGSATPTITGIAILPLPTSTPTSGEGTEPEEPTDTPTPVVPTQTELPPTPTDTPTIEPSPTDYPDPTDIPDPTDTPEDPTDIPDPTDVPDPTEPTERPDPTDIPGFGDEEITIELPKHTPRPTKTPKP